MLLSCKAVGQVIHINNMISMKIHSQIHMQCHLWVHVHVGGHIFMCMDTHIRMSSCTFIESVNSHLVLLYICICIFYCEVEKHIGNRARKCSLITVVISGKKRRKVSRESLFSLQCLVLSDVRAKT